MGTIIGAILLVLLGIFVIVSFAHILLDILGVVLIVAAVVLIYKVVAGRRTHSGL